MKKLTWMLLALFTLAAAGLRVLQNRTGFESTGLAVPGNLPALLLFAVLALAAACFLWASRSLPAQRDVTGGMLDCFPFRETLSLMCAVAGIFLTFAGAALLLPSGGTSVLLAPLVLVGGGALFYVVFSCRRGTEPRSVALLAPALAMALYLVFVYRADAANPVLMRIYMEILALCALTLTAMERAAFAYRNGAPRIYVPLSAMSVVLALTAATDQKSLPVTLLFAGWALVELGFLAEAKFE